MKMFNKTKNSEMKNTHTYVLDSPRMINIVIAISVCSLAVNFANFILTLYRNDYATGDRKKDELAYDRAFY